MNDECWLWEGKTLNGYGVARGVPGVSGFTHRLSYEVLVGPIPEGLDLDHSCRVRHCYNPRHLDPATRSENLRRRPLPPTCGNGHLRCPENARPCKLPRYDCAVCHRNRERMRKAA